MRRVATQAQALLLAMAACPVALGHHSATAFDLQQTVAVEGTVVRFDWTNPHVYLTVLDRDGISWLVESDGTAILARSGWNRDSFKKDDVVSLRMYPGRNQEKHHGLLMSVSGPADRTLSSLARTGDRTVFESNARATSLD